MANTRLEIFQRRLCPQFIMGKKFRVKENALSRSEFEAMSSRISIKCLNLIKCGATKHEEIKIYPTPISKTALA